MFKLGPLANVTTIAATIAANKDYLRKVSREEKEEWINGLAGIYRKQGFRVGEHDDGRANEILQKIIEATGLGRSTVERYLSSDFKQEPLEGVSHMHTPVLEKAEKALGEEGFKKLDCNYLGVH